MPIWLQMKDLKEMGRVSGWTEARRQISKGLLPAPYEVGPQKRIWRKDEIDECDARLKKRVYAPSASGLGIQAQLDNLGIPSRLSGQCVEGCANERRLTHEPADTRRQRIKGAEGRRLKAPNTS